MGESMGWEGVFEAVKGYLQPALQALVVTGLAWPLVSDGLSETQRTAILVGPIYFGLHLIAAAASRTAHRLVTVSGSEESAARRLWAVNTAAFVALAGAAWAELLPAAVCVFVVLHALQSCWRPILISRFDSCSGESQGATVLSIESQAQRSATMIVAPVLGWAVDSVKRHGIGGEFWPVGAVGAASALFFFATARRVRTEAPRAGS
jgi:hypothetical protein